MNAAKKYYLRNLARDRIRHKERIEWLSGSNPKWACGEAVSSYDQSSLLRRSQEIVQKIDARFRYLRDPRNIK